MNGLALRINRGGGGKCKNSIAFSPIQLPPSLFENAAESTEEIQAFIKSTCSDDQLVIIKNIIDASKEGFDNVVLKFLVATFFHAEAKHPIKCFISRHIIKNNKLQQPFSEELASQVLSLISENPSNYKQYVDVVGKLMMSIENFPAGVVALHSVEVTLAEYLKCCLRCCTTTLREQNTLSPTEKNEIFNLCHLTLRLILHIIQRSTNDSLGKLILMFDDIRLNIHDLMYDDDVPMDTKSLSGILYLTMHVTEKGTDSWIQVLNSSSASNELSKLMQLEAARLSLYSAVPTVVPPDHLLTRTLDDGVAIIVLTDKILEIGESSSESAFILGVTRTLLQVSKLLLQLPNSPESEDKRDNADKSKTSDENESDDRCDSGDRRDSGDKRDNGNNMVGLSLVESLLRFAWGHLEHYMDSVRHLTAQMLGVVVKYCAYMDARGDSAALEMLSVALRCLSRGRKSYYVCAACLATHLRARRLLPLLQPGELVHALRDSALRNSASTALEAMLDKLCSECDTAQISTELVQPCLQAARTSADAGELAVLEKLLVRACTKREQLLHDLLSYIRSASSSVSAQELKCVLMLVRVARRLRAEEGGRPSLAGTDALWRGLISYDLLKRAAVDAVDENRVLCMCVVCESPRSTEPLQGAELRVVLRALRYNCNVQAPNFRQLLLSYINKFIKRLDESYKVLRRQMRVEGVPEMVASYLQFAEDLRRQCFASLVPGANYSRRFVALQILAWCEQITLEGYHKSWEPEYVEKLLLHLEDSYENNKGFALEVLASCPPDLLRRKDYSIGLDLEDIIRQASSLKPTDCVSAAYKLELLRTRLPERIVPDEQSEEVVLLGLVQRLARECGAQCRECSRSILRGAAAAPMFGVLHCLRAVLHKLDPLSISRDEQWRALIAQIIDTCMEVNAVVACVVNNSSPEGHLPMDMTIQITDHGNSGNVTLEDGRQVTAQMVLLCAWRSVKEVSLLLGEISGRLTIREECEGGEEGEGSLSAAQLRAIGEHFTALLSDTQHRGAFEQAYVGFTMLLDRLWRCRSAELHGLPRAWLQRLMQIIAGATTAPTRRSAGIPFIIQALVTTEVAVQDNGLCFQYVMSELVRMVGGGGGGEAGSAGRTHALHVVRALVRHAALAQRGAPHLQAALCAALRAFDARCWPERNSSTLLLSALVQRVFGVQRTTMTGRIFFLRYPKVYDFMLEKLQEVSMEADSAVLRPSLYPILLLLARLYPSSLEGTVSNLKLSAFIPRVCACAGSAVLKTRHLAARALVPLVSPALYIPHIESTLELVQQEHTKMNYVHGLLLQLVQLLQAGGGALQPGGGAQQAGAGLLRGWEWAPRLRPVLWRLRAPCYLVADELVKIINLLVMRSSTAPQDLITEICSHLHTLIFETAPTAISAGRDVCLANAMYLYLILATRYHVTDQSTLVHSGLQHKSYEVVLTVLNYLLILHKQLEADNNMFHEHLTSIADPSSLDKIKNKTYIQFLCNVLKSHYKECREKSLKILVLEGNTQRDIIETKIGVAVTDDMVVEKLIDCIQTEYETLTHVYLQSLVNFVSERIQAGSICTRVVLNVISTVYECSSAENCENTRKVAASFIERNYQHLFKLDTRELTAAEQFELQATVWATIITLLEDDEEIIRQRVSDVVSDDRVIPSRAARLALNIIRRQCAGAGGVALFALIALLDFQSVVVMADDVSDECRVFDQNERYNIFLEESIWTITCGDIIANEYKVDNSKLLEIISRPDYEGTFEKLCKDNLDMYRKMAAGHKLPRNEALNPKIKLLVDKLRDTSAQ